MPRYPLLLSLLCLALLRASGAMAMGTDLSRFEARHLHSIDLTPDGSKLLVLNTPDARLSVFALAANVNFAPVLVAEIPVGLEPVSVRARTNNEVWVINELSDSVSIVDLQRGVVVATLEASDEPADVVFAGQKAFVSCARNNVIRVFDGVTREPLGLIPVEGIFPRALAVNEAGTKLYAAFLLSGNHTTTLAAALAPAPTAPTNPDLPAAPKTGLLVAASDSRIAYTVLDRDVVEIDTATLGVLRYLGGVGTNLYDLAVQPGSGDLWVANTEALNLVRFEPNLRGHFIENRLTRVAAASGAVTTFDLNAGLDYSLLPNPAAQASAFAQPVSVVFAPGGGSLWVAAHGSDQVVKLSPDGTLQLRVDLRTGVLPGTSGTEKMRGPRSLVLDAVRGRLFVFNKLSATVSILSTAQGTILAEFAVGSFDPTPERLKLGRKLFADARLSGNGTAACTSCHPDADQDGIAWDLGDPGGEMVYNTGTNLGNSTVLVRALHPMKGPMVTQTLRGLVGTGDLHWRADKKDIQSFNSTFDKLMGGSMISPEAMDALADYLKSLRHYPNPNRTIDDHLPASLLGGDPVRGQGFFTTYKGNCFECHALPLTSNNNIDSNREVGSPQPLKTPTLRTVYQRVYFDSRAGRTALSGFGLGHDGTGFELPTGHPYVLDALANQQEFWDVTAFVLSVDTGTAPAVGSSVTVTRENRGNAAMASRVATLQHQTFLGKAELVIRGTVGGRSLSFRYQAETDRYLPDSVSATPLTLTELLVQLEESDAVTFVGAAPGAGKNLAGDRDDNGVLDRDEPAPALSLSRPGPGVFRLEWSPLAKGWTVETTQYLGGPWTQSARPPTAVGAALRFEENLLPEPTSLFFRLRRTW